MTTPYERTKAVIETREFLKLLASSDGVASRREIQVWRDNLDERRATIRMRMSRRG
ncbi:BPSL0761 family protein [Burkholderia vietnamiensis]|uniref:BPSL0761 family protein n=1 Tax=Burkholderia vietnamiensis TaxID=60552 RepID=UPI0024AF13DB|nr:BPSL0761 family protein [Burkholderia vietnamiensis]